MDIDRIAGYLLMLAFAVIVTWALWPKEGQ